MKTNREHLVKLSVIGKVHSPTILTPYRVSNQGIPMVLPSVGGICYNYKIGDDCMNLAGDHVEPGVSIKNDVNNENAALMYLACVGNSAKVVSGDAKGKTGIVTGMHGGIDHVLIYFDDETLGQLAIDDKIQIRAIGTGLKIEGYDDIHVMNIDPDLLERIPIEESNGNLYFPVVAEVPAYLMGSGIGSSSADSGDYDIMSGDIEALKELGLDSLRFGDFVYLRDCDNTFGRQYLKGAATIGVVVHSNCIISGHGPGVTTLLSTKAGTIKPKIDPDANLKKYL